MRMSRIALTTCGVAIILGVSAFRNYQEQKKWRVTTVTEINPGKLEARANELGDKGWELVTCVQTSVTYQVRCWFKRQTGLGESDGSIF